MINLESSVKNAEYKGGKNFKHQKQVHLEKLLMNNEKPKKNLPLKNVNKHEDYTMENLNVLINMYIHRKKNTDTKNYLNIVFENGKTQLSIPSKNNVHYINLLRKLGFGYITNIKTKLNKNPNENNIGKVYYHLHLTKNFHQAIDCILKKYHQKFESKLLSLSNFTVDFVSNVIYKAFPKYFKRDWFISRLMFGFFAMFFGMLVEISMQGSTHILPLLFYMIFYGLTSALFSMAGIGMACIIINTILCLLIDEPLFKDLDKHEKSVAEIFSKYSTKNQSNALNILRTYNE